MLATARPEVLELVGAGAGYVAAAAQVGVGPLSGEETAELARNCLGAKSLPTELHALILERSGGNPLFAEELVRLLQDRDLLVNRSGQTVLKEGAELPLPDSIGALIAARLDLLNPDRKALLADASVVGRTFWVGAVAAVGAADAAQVYESLIELVAKELVRPVRGSSIEGETEFLFVHALVCDVAYAQLTRADRAAKHAALARWLEERTAGRTEDLAEILAYHYGMALEMAGACGLFELEDELSEPTARYLEMAGGRAAPLDAAAAAQHYARAERVADEAAKPKRRWLLSRRTRRTLRRRAPLLAAAAAVIVVAAVAALAIWEFKPAAAKPVTMTASQIANKYGTSVVDITAKARRIVDHTLIWKTVTESGVVASKDGLIFTSGNPLMNRTLGYGPEVVTVGYYESDGRYRTVRGDLISADTNGTLAIVKVDPRKAQLEPMPLGDSESIQMGERVVALNRVYGLLGRGAGAIQSITAGSDDNTNTQYRVLHMRTSASLKRPTGGPLIDVTGHLIGVMGNAYYSATGSTWDNTGPGAAVPVDWFTYSVTNLERAVQKAYPVALGIDAIDWITPSLARSLGLAAHRGILVRDVMPGSPAAKAGLRGGTREVTTKGAPVVGSDGLLHPERHYNVVGGDIILSIDGRPANSLKDVRAVLGHATPGSVVVLHVLRGSKSLILRVTPGPKSLAWWIM